MTRMGFRTSGSFRRGTGLSGLLVALALVVASPHALAQQVRDDLVIPLDPTSFVAISFDGESPGPVSILEGFVQMQAEDAQCVASPDNPCNYVIKLIRIQLSNFPLPTNFGTYTVAQPFIALEGPIAVTDFGGGVQIPALVFSETGGFVSGPEISSGWRTTRRRTPQPINITLDANEQEFTIGGTIDMDFRVADQTIQGSGIVDSGSLQPWINVPPIADAGDDQTVLCPQLLRLDGSATIDLDGNLFSARWSEGGGVLAETLVADVFFGFGTHFVTLQAFDTFGGLGVDDVTIQVNDQTPVFTFVPPDVTTTQCGALNIGQAQAQAPCGVQVTNNAPAQFFAGVTAVTWTATSPTGLSVRATQVVTVLLADSTTCCPPGSTRIVGTSNNDTLVGTANADCIVALGAQDTIDGLGGNDVISAGHGDDVIRAGAGHDHVEGGPGQDQLFGGNGNDSLVGGDGDDRVFGEADDDRLVGGQGQDRLFCGPGNDAAFGSDGDDELDGSTGIDLLDGGVNRDRCIAGETVLSCE